jgi:2-oxoglutarate ferredoxin oxidoreductase subunit gamma
MNGDSLPLCEGILKTGGLMVINSTLVKEEPKRTDFRVVTIDAQGIAEKIGSSRFANMVALGAMAKLTGALAITDIEGILKKFFPPDKHRFIPENVAAIQSGYTAV